LFGRGWDQNDWKKKEYPDKAILDSLFPNVPVFLLRVDGHAALVNNAALKKSGINVNTIVEGGLIEKKNGRLTGILMDAAVDLVYKIIPHLAQDDIVTELKQAEKNCVAVGLTSVTDAGIENNGLKWNTISLIDSLQKAGDLKIRVNAMAATDEMDFYKTKGKIRTAYLSVRSFKVYTDGALGSRGACLLEPYSDKPGHTGFLIHSPAYYDSIANNVAAMGWQLNSHCIGDSAHRMMLKIYSRYCSAAKDLRWRVEHAQVIDSSDIGYYRGTGIIPSVQPVHATSDMYWAEDRLGSKRIHGAYAYADLLKAAGLIATGSDFPVESINPLYGYYAAVSRKDQKNYPEKGYMKNNGLTKKEALQAMTIWSAYAAFTEHETGSIEAGKYADFVILDHDLLTMPESDLWKVKVRSTYINGMKVYQREE
jgi:predicted amidohydrolase YtcJ